MTSYACSNLYVELTGGFETTESSLVTVGWEYSPFQGIAFKDITKLQHVQNCSAKVVTIFIVFHEDYKNREEENLTT